jgi:hypothetical protein
MISQTTIIILYMESMPCHRVVLLTLWAAHFAALSILSLEYYKAWFEHEITATEYRD